MTLTSEIHHSVEETMENTVQLSIQSQQHSADDQSSQSTDYEAVFLIFKKIFPAYIPLSKQLYSNLSTNKKICREAQQLREE
mmetsp:Transcript_102237/g.153170  ORF Transcript_102237/g.153170 Transcript_102237/m.153170 type:complete len:82 (-) Transcript_102237:148-393(-)